MVNVLFVTLMDSVTLSAFNLVTFCDILQQNYVFLLEHIQTEQSN